MLSTPQLRVNDEWENSEQAKKVLNVNFSMIYANKRFNMKVSRFEVGHNPLGATTFNLLTTEPSECGTGVCVEKIKQNLRIFFAWKTSCKAFPSCAVCKKWFLCLSVYMPLKLHEKLFPFAAAFLCFVEFTLSCYYARVF